MTPTSPAAKPPSGFGAPFAALVAGALAMGISPIFVRLADVGPFASAFWRVALALPVLCAWMRFSESGRRRPSRGYSARDDPRRPRLHRRSLLLASVDRHHQRRQRDLLRHHRADLGGRCSAGCCFGERAAPRDARRPRALCIAGRRRRCWRRASTCARRARSAISTGWPPASSSASISWRCKAARRDALGGARHLRGDASITAALLLVVALALERDDPAAQLSAASPRCWRMAWISHAGGQGLLSVALGRLPAAFSSLVIFLEAIAAAGFAFVLLGEPVSLDPGARRPGDSRRHLCRAADVRRARRTIEAAPAKLTGARADEYGAATRRGGPCGRESILHG